MKILLLDPIPKVNYRISKDTSGGYGTGNDFGYGIIPTLLKKSMIKNSDWPSLFCAYTFSVLKKNNHEVKYSKYLDEDYKDFELIIIVSSIVSHETEIDIIKTLHEKIKIFVIGPFASENHKLYTKYNNVSVIKGEQEFFFLQNEKLEEYFKIPLIENKFTVEDLDLLPFNDFEKMGFDLDKINNLFSKGKSVPMLATRGCPFSCFKYCVYPLQQGRKVRQRNVKKIVDEINFWKSEFKVKTIIFRDPVFSINRKHTVDLCNEIISRNVKIKFVIETHLKILDSELIDLLKKAGLIGVKVGVESYSNDVLKDASRYTIKTDEQITKIKELESKKISVSSMFIIGFPTDTEETILSTINYARKLNTSFAQFSIWTPYPGTPVFENFKNKIETDKFENFNQYQLVYKHPLLDKKKARYFLNKAYNSYYLRLTWFFKFLYFRFVNS